MSEELNAIFHASTQGRTDIVQAAIDSIRGTSPTQSNRVDKTIASLISTGRAEDNATPLHVASSQGHADVIRALLHAGADLCVRANNGAFADLRPYEVCKTEAAREAYHVFLFEAIAMNHLNKFTDLLDGGVPASVADASTKDTPLHWAASFNNIQVAEDLLKREKCHLEINACNSAGQTALHLACKSASVEMCRLLLTFGADLNMEDAHGNLPPDLVNPDDFSTTEAAADMVNLLRNPPPLTLTTVKKGKGKLSSAAENANGKDTNSKLKSHSSSVSSDANHRARRHTVSADGSEYSFESDARSGRLGQSMDGDDEDLEDMSGGGDGCVSHPMFPILVIWPPPQRMNRRSYEPFVISNETTLKLTAPSAELDTVSLLIETLNGFNIQAEVSSPSAGVTIKLSIDPNICPKRNSYELIIDPRQAQLVAADSVGLRYGVDAFVQLMQIHTDFTMLESGITEMKMPSISISDWPDIEHRAVLWSHRSIATHTQAIMRDMISLLSQLHLNSILLAIDPCAIADHETLCDEYNTIISASQQEYKHESDEEQESNQDLHSISDICVRYHMSLIPTLVFTTLRQYVPPSSLRHFTSDTILLNFDYTQARAVEELVGVALQRRERTASASSEGINDIELDEDTAKHIVTKIDVENALKQRCADVISSVQKAGFATIILVCNAWTKGVVNPQEIAFRFGLGCVERPAALVFPKQLFVKPFMCCKEMIRLLYSSTLRARELGNSMSVLPAFVDNDCLMPILLIKYQAFLHAGFAWNSVAVADMLSEPVNADANVLKEVVYLRVFAHQAESMNAEVVSTILGMFTGQLFATDRAGGSSGTSTASAINENRHMARVDRILYALISTRENVGALPAITKEEAAMCVKHYRRLLLQAKWKPGQKSTPEAEEFFSVLNLLHTLGKVIIYAYGSREKMLSSIGENATLGKNISSGSLSSSLGSASGATSEYLSYAALLGSLSPGTNSDTANNFLESLEHCTRLWKRRFQSIWFLQPKFYEKLRAKRAESQSRANTNLKSGASSSFAGGSASGESDEINREDSLKHSLSARFLSSRQIRANYYRKERQGVPVTAIFNAGILAKLPQPKVVETTLIRLFGGGEED